MTSEELERLGSIQQELWAIYEFWPRFVCERHDGGLMPYGKFQVSMCENDEAADDLDALSDPWGNDDSIDPRQVCFEALMHAYRNRCVAILAELAAAGITDQQDPPEGLLT